MSTTEPYCSVDAETEALARENVILRSEVGSTVYGTGLPGKEDHDEVGVTIMPPWEVLSPSRKPMETMVWRTAGASTRSTPQDTDLAIYGLRKFLALSAQGNPSILVTLWTPWDKVFERTDVGTRLKERRGLFVTKSAGHRFLGYMRAQRSRMEDSRAGSRAYRTNRPELVQQYGYDTKFAMHMIRLGQQGIELMDTGNIVLPIPGIEGFALRGIRQGKWAYKSVLDYATELENELVDRIAKVDLPEKPDRDMVEDLSYALHWEHWGVHGYL